MKTIIQLLEESAVKFANNPFLWEKKTDKFEPTTFKQTQDLVYKYAAGLMALGVEHGDRIAILSEGRNDWVISELSVLYTGASDVPLSIKLTPVELEFRLNHSESKMIIVSGGQYPKIKEIKENLKTVERIIFLDHQENIAENEINLSDVYLLGEEFLRENRDKLIARKDAVTGDDYANITYTSGTTADPKGVILTHRNYTANVEQALTIMNIPEHYRTLIIIPLDHCYGHVIGIYIFMKMGASMGTVQTGSTPMETLKNIPLNIKELKPNLILSVPALAKNFKKNIEAGVRAKGPKIEKLFNNALQLSYKYNKEGYNKENWRIGARIKLWFYDQILFKKLRDVFGGKMEFFVGGGALLDIELQKFFYAIGIPMLQGYGLSEATPIISGNSLTKHKLGSSGFPVQPMEIKICDDDDKEVAQGEKGEIVIKGENVMKGYWKNEEATKKTIIDGWLHTGDMGYLDADGFLYVLGRFKSLLIGSDGEKFSPESIEEAFVEKSKLFDQSMLHNNQDPYTIGLIVPNKEALKRVLKELNYNLKEHETYQRALQIIQEEVNAYKTGGKFGNEFPERWLPSAIGILDEPFTEQNKMVNSTMKMVRGKVAEHYKDRMEFLFTPEGKNIVNEHNVTAIKNLLMN